MNFWGRLRDAEGRYRECRLLWLRVDLWIIQRMEVVASKRVMQQSIFAERHRLRTRPKPEPLKVEGTSMCPAASHQR